MDMVSVTAAGDQTTPDFHQVTVSPSSTKQGSAQVLSTLLQHYTSSLNAQLTGITNDTEHEQSLKSLLL